MTGKTLVIQFRQDITMQHEQECINRIAGAKTEIGYMDVFDTKNNLENPEDYIFEFDRIVLGGSAGISMGPDHLDNDYTKVEFIQKRMDRLLKYITQEDFPCLGVCYGHQMLGKFLGSPVLYDQNQAETGFAEIRLTEAGMADRIFTGISPEFYAVVGHQDSLEGLPKECWLLAASDRCKVQAFRYKKHVYGIQFHGELEEKDLMYRLSLFPVYQKYAQSLEIRQTDQAVKVLKNFLEISVN